MRVRHSADGRPRAVSGPPSSVRFEVRYAAAVSIVETILVFVVIPGAIYGLVSLATLRKKFAGAPRYRPGQEWDYPPVWWSANPEGVRETHRDTPDGYDPGSASTARGGASGSW